MGNKDESPIHLRGVRKPPVAIRRARSADQHEVNQKLRRIVDNFRGRATWFRSHITRPLSPATDGPGSRGSETEYDAEAVMKTFEKDVFAPLVGSKDVSVKLTCCGRFCQPIDPQSTWYVLWLLTVSGAFLYNAWSLPLRSVFPYQDAGNFLAWMSVDYLCDSVYVLDVLYVEPRVMFLNPLGFYERDSAVLRKHYAKTSECVLGLFSIAPTDVAYILLGFKPILRFNRLFKVQSLWRFFDRCERIVADPHGLRILRTLIYMLYMVHINACLYYAVSVAEGIGSTTWTFQGDGIAYVRCFYLAFKTANSIGRNLKPTNAVEYIYMTISWLMGVFVFAFLIGQIRDIVATATREQTEYQRLRDQAGKLLHRLNVPKSIRRKVNTWFSYTWREQKCFDERDLLEGMPRKLREDVTLSVHLKTLSRVKLITDCAGRDSMLLLRDLVLKLKPVTFLPGDFVCKEGEIGREMFILKAGKLDVLGGDDGKTVLVTLHEGSVIGEVSLLADSEGARRTRDVVSQGFSTLFALSKGDLTETIRDYPEAQKALRAKARELLHAHHAVQKLNLMRDMCEMATVIKTEPKKPDPKLLNVVKAASGPQSFTVELLEKGRHARKRRQQDGGNSEEIGRTD